MVELDLTKAINNLIDGKATEQEQKVCGICFKALMDKGEKYRWHIISKDKQDFPEDGEEVLCVYKSKEKGTEFREHGEYNGTSNEFPFQLDYKMDYWDVVAWKRIEPLWEEE